MNPKDILRYGHETFLASIAQIPDSEWLGPGVCGHWSAKDILAHMASFEVWHVEVLGIFLHVEPQPMMAARAAGEFNDQQVLLRQDVPVEALLEEYQAAHDVLILRAGLIPDTEYTRVGSLSWYGAEYALDDFLVYSNYGHKREHSAQLYVYADRFRSSI